MASGETIGSGDFRVRKFSDTVAEVVRDRILTGTIAAGERINEVALSEELRISRSPLREALRSLSGEGLVVLTPGKGAYVVEFDEASLIELSELRLPLAVATVRLAAERANSADLRAFQPVMAEIRAAIEDPTLPYPHHVDFHELISQAAKSPRLAAASNAVERQLRLARIRSGNTPERAQNALHEHELIYETIAAHDRYAAEAAMREHIAAGTASFIALVADNR